ncbi:MAG: winged helix DNA-binding domain-containing protein [Candidatus Geothermincolia bacterium]
MIDVVERMVGLQAQSFPAASLQVRARSRGLSHLDTESALWADHTVLRTWCMRGTLHLVAAADVRWLLNLIGPTIIRRSKSRYKQLGIGDSVSERASAVMKKELARNGPMTRRAVFEALNRQGISTAGQTGIHLVQRAAVSSLICFGPNTGGAETFVLLDDWLPAGRQAAPSDPPTELARRFLASYGPATPEDFTTWSGLGAAVCNSAWSSLSPEFNEVDRDGKPAWLLKLHLRAARSARVSEGPVCLLPSFDPYLLGYKDKTLAVAPIYSKRVNAGGGIVRPVMVTDGKVRGTWKSESRSRTLEVRVEPFDSLTYDEFAGLELEAADVGRYLGSKYDLKVTARA